jgi:hypothetical protein
MKNNTNQPNNASRCILLFIVSLVCAVLIVYNPARYWWLAPVGVVCFSIMAFLLSLNFFHSMDKTMSVEDKQREENAYWMDKQDPKSGSRHKDKYRNR